MEVTMSRVSLSLAVLVAVFCCADAMNYLAFPRMGRSGGHHALFRRSTDDDDDTDYRSDRTFNFPRGFFSPRKREYLSFPDETSASHFVDAKRELPWNFIVPRKKGLPKGFFVPRKRGYLAFPRMGRSGVKADSDSGCCGVGLKEQFAARSDGKEVLSALCKGDSDCCEGLREVVYERSGGVYYSLCVPDMDVFPEGGSPALNKLKNILRQ